MYAFYTYISIGINYVSYRIVFMRVNSLLVPRVDPAATCLEHIPPVESILTSRQNVSSALGG